MPSLREMLQGFDAVVVTGGSSGIGKSFIELLSKLNPDLWFCNLSRNKPDIEIDQLKLRHLSCDLSKSSDVERGADEVLNYLRSDQLKLKILLINNSGFGSYGFFPTPNLEHQTQMIDLNVRAMVHFTGLLLPLMKERGGAVMNIASTAAFQPTAYMATYGATKTFVLHWSLALREELRGSGVHVIAVCPGPTSTQFFKRAGLTKGSVPDAFGETPEQVVNVSLAALAAEKGMVVSGWKNKILSFFSSKLPKALAARVGAFVLARFRLKQAAS